MSIRPWAIGRRIQYGSGFALVWLLVGVLVYFTNYYEPASCFDGVMNASERGIDCGGGCVRICAMDTLPPRVVWAKSFEIAPGQYNAVAYVENPNQTAATPELAYTFELLRDGVVVGQVSGVTVLPPNSVYPIFEGRVLIHGNDPITETRIELGSADMWLPASIGRDQFQTANIELTGADSRPRLDVEMENTALLPAEDVEIVATIINDAGEPVTASRSFIEEIDARSTADVVFTWPNPIAKTVRSCIIPTDVVLGIDLSGSMNNDGGNPPQPVSSALAAASQFVRELSATDQVAVVTFASDVAATQLTNQHASAASTISALQIDAAEEQGFTNTAAALLAAQNELNSSRHNEDARRVLVLLTDGLPTAPGNIDIVAETEATATMLDEDGIQIYAIGLGENVDRAFVERIASEQNNAYFAASGENLASIYTEITSALCESGLTKVDVIAKTKTNFAPLR